MNEHGLKEVDDAYRDGAAVLSHAPQHFGYRAVIVDEAQDMSMQAFRLIRKIVPQGANDMFIVGDGHPRIYGRNKAVLSRCDINIRGRSRRLRVNYRTTEETRRWAVKLLEEQKIDDLDGGEDRQTAYRSLTHGAAPLIKRFDDFEADLEERALLYVAATRAKRDVTILSYGTPSPYLN